MLIYYSGVTKSMDPRDIVPGSSVMAAFSGSQKTELRGKNYFMDSGSFSLLKKAAKYRTTSGREPESYYKTEEHIEYVNGYAKFIKDRIEYLDIYANVDVIGLGEKGAKLSLLNQRYLEEEHGLKPMPVLHNGEPLRFLAKYLEAGHTLIGLGGLAGLSLSLWSWVETVFLELKKSNVDVRVHGFGVTGYDKILRYPWYSVDSTTWVKTAGFGQIIVPNQRKYGRGKREFVFDLIPSRVFVSEHEEGQAYKNHTGNQHLNVNTNVEEWLDFIDVKYTFHTGNEERKKIFLEPMARIEANLKFFELARVKKATTLGVRPPGFDTEILKTGV